MTETPKPCPFCGNAPQVDEGLVSCPLCRMTWIPPNMWNTRRTDLARPAPAEGAVKPLEWDERNRAQGYRVQPTYGQDRKPYILTRDGNIIWAYDTIEDAKAEAQADWERRILSALSSPEDATPAEDAIRADEREKIASALDDEADTTPDSEDATVVRDCARLVRAGFSYDEAERLADATPAAPVSVEEAVKVLLAECERRAPSVQEYDDEVFPSVHDFGAFQETLQELAKKQDRRAALREMQSIREEMEGESGDE